MTTAKNIKEEKVKKRQYVTYLTKLYRNISYHILYCINVVLGVFSTKASF